MDLYYSAERNVQIVLYLLKALGIKKVIASPGATNVTVVASMQQDSWFEMYSCIDERSAAYMAVGMADESDEPVVLSCTGATSSRNYMPALTEAYYRKLPIIVITSSQDNSHVGNLIAQVTDRSNAPRDTVISSIYVQNIRSPKDEWDVNRKVNQILQLYRDNPGPVHINLATGMGGGYGVKELPETKVIRKYIKGDELPSLPIDGHLGVFIGSHNHFNKDEIDAIDNFCASNNAVVFCDHTSRYYGKYKVLFSLIGAQEKMQNSIADISVLIHIGEISGDYDTLCNLRVRELWRVNPDGEFRDVMLGNLSKVFAMNEMDFFKSYSNSINIPESTYLLQCKELYSHLINQLQDFPFSNIYAASILASKIPEGSSLYLGILNSLRSWNYFETKASVCSISNVGGFGIDGIVSSLVGASLCNPDKLYFGVLGDLSFFYDMNVLGNRHIGGNIRLLVVNNAHGQEFNNYNHAAAILGKKVNKYVAAEGHNGCKSPSLLKHYAEDLGFEYISSSSKEEFNTVYQRFLRPKTNGRSIVFELFTNGDDENEALRLSRNLMVDKKLIVKRKLRNIVDKVLLRD